MMPEQLTELLGMLMSSIQDGGAAAGIAGVGIMLAIYVADWLKLLNKLPPKGKKWLAVGLSALGGAATAMPSSGLALAPMAMGMFTAAATSIGSWELVKPMMPKRKPKAASMPKQKAKAAPGRRER